MREGKQNAINPCHDKSEVLTNQKVQMLILWGGGRSFAYMCIITFHFSRRVVYTSVLILFVLWYSPNHTPIKYKWSFKQSNQITPANHIPLPNVATFLGWTKKRYDLNQTLRLFEHPYIEWHVVRCESKTPKRHMLKRDSITSSPTILSSIVNMFGGGLYDHFMRSKILHFWQWIKYSHKLLE